MKRHLFLIIGAILLSCVAAQAALVMNSVKTLDTLRSQRDKYSSSERITFSASVYTDIDVSKIDFTFTVYDPLNRAVFTHTGNSIPGTVGTGGSELANVNVAQFYSGPGAYAIEVTATPQTGGSAVSGRSTFSIYSPIIILSYPGNGSKDLIDQPLVFRWIGSGASQYRIYIGDNQAFYNPMMVVDTMDTFYSYPQNPTDTRQKLLSGQVYYWKVDGIDASGNKVASSQVPFSFSMRQDAGSTASDVAITLIALGTGVSSSGIPIDVTVQNMGGRVESNITVTLYISGMLAGTQKVDFLNVSESRVITFKVDPGTLVPGQPLFVSATHDLFDSNIKNNILTAVLKVDSGIFSGRLAKIMGRITELSKDKGEGKGIEGIKIKYEGPRAGEILSGEGGQYKIEGLPVGTYTLTVSHPDYKQDKKEISIEEAKPYTNVDFKLERKESKKYTLDEIWAIIQEHVSGEIVSDLEGYTITEINGPSEREIYGLVDQLKDDKAKITEAKISY
jgi:hypothetical protein